jgi:hypothetical protein
MCYTTLLTDVGEASDTYHAFFLIIRMHAFSMAQMQVHHPQKWTRQEKSYRRRGEVTDERRVLYRRYERRVLHADINPQVPS